MYFGVNKFVMNESLSLVHYQLFELQIVDSDSFNNLNFFLFAHHPAIGKTK